MCRSACFFPVATTVPASRRCCNAIRGRRFVRSPSALKTNVSTRPRTRKGRRLSWHRSLQHFCTYWEAMEIVPRLPEIYDEPFETNSAVPTTLVVRSRASRSRSLYRRWRRNFSRVIPAPEEHGYLNRLSGIPVALRKSASALLPIASGGTCRATVGETSSCGPVTPPASLHYQRDVYRNRSTGTDRLTGETFSQRGLTRVLEPARIPDPLQQVLTLECKPTSSRISHQRSTVRR